MQLSEMPIFRMYKLKIDQSNREDFVKAGVNDFLTSYQNEPGTLAMYATHLDTAGTDNYVFEFYQNEAHYQIHAQSPQFKAYGQLAQKVVIDKSLQELTPQKIQTLQQDMVISGANDYYVKMTTFQATPDLLIKLQSINEKAIYYLATLDEKQRQWICLELLQENKKTVLDGLIETMASNKVVKLLKVDTLVNRSFNLSASNPNH